MISVRFFLRVVLPAGVEPALVQRAGGVVEQVAQKADDENGGHQVGIGQAVAGVEDEVTQAGRHAEHFCRVESVAEVLALPSFDGPVALLAQTTLSHRDWEGVAVAVRERYPQVWSPGRSDLDQECRQARRPSRWLGC